MLFGCLLTLFDDIGDSRGVECTDRLFEIWQYRNDLGVVHGIVKSEGRLQDIVHIDAVEMRGHGCVGIHPFPGWHFESNCGDHITALLACYVDVVWIVELDVMMI